MKAPRTSPFPPSPFLRASLPLGVALALLLLPLTIAGDCGPGSRAFYGYSFINPTIADFDPTRAPFFLDFGKIYEQFFQSQQEIYQIGNANEWVDRYCDNATPEEVRYVVYTTSRYQLEDLRAIMDNPNANVRMLGPLLAGNAWVKYLLRHQCHETVDYLIFAKTCEPYVVATADTWREPNRDVVAMRRLIDEAHQRFLRTESDYIKLRYAFQAIRLAHYAKDYQQTLDLVAYYMPKIDNDPSQVEYWIKGHKAGALQALGRRPEAAYLYSVIFDKCPGKRESAFRSFRIDTDEEWAAALLYCKNDRERANLYVLRANSKNALLIPEMENIYTYDPQHPALEMLLVKELQKLEKDLLGAAFNPQQDNNLARYKIPRAYAGQRVIDLQNLVRKWLKEDKLALPALWQLAEGYLEVLAGNYYFAERTFTDVEPRLKTKNLQEQLAVFRLVLKIMSLDQINDQAERELGRLNDKYKFYTAYPDFPKLVNDKMRILYRDQGDGAKAYLMEYSLRQLRINPDLPIIDELIDLCNKEKRTPFENSLVANKEGGGTIKNELNNLKAAYLLSQGLPESAMEAMKDIPTTDWDNFGQFNPFVRRFSDCVNCLLPDSVTSVNRGQLIQRLLDLEYEARAATSPNAAAELYFKLGEAYYNMTYFGQSWKATDAFRSSASAARVYRDKGKNVLSYPGLPLGNRENFDCQHALRYFDLARRAATSPEIKVAAAYMAAKCERNEFYTQNNRRTFDYFSIIQADYQETEFYQRIIKECRDFQAFVLK